MKGKAPTKGDLLEKYADRSPKAFTQLDGWHSGEMTGGQTFELMYGANVRVLIDRETSANQAADLLSKMADWLRRCPDLLPPPEKKVEQEAICPGCGHFVPVDDIPF